MRDIVAVIPARSGSKRVPKKNLRLFQGKPLIWYSIRAAQLSKYVNRVVVSTDDQEIIKICNEMGIEVSVRPNFLATDEAATWDVLKDLYETWSNKRYHPELMVVLQPTSPLRKKDFIDQGIKLLIDDSPASGLISLYKLTIFTGRIRNSNWIADFPDNTRSQDIEPYYIPSGSLYIYRCNLTISVNNPYGSKTLPLIEDKLNVVNIDVEDDFIQLERVFSYAKEEYSHFF